MPCLPCFNEDIVHSGNEPRQLKLLSRSAAIMKFGTDNV